MSKGEVIEKAAPALPAEMTKAFAEFAGQGLETMTERDKATPFLGLIQALSPQINKTEPKYIPGAEPGDIFNTVTGELYKTGVLVVPVHYEKVWNTWVPRDAGGGFLGSYEDAALSKQRFVTNRGAEYDGEPQVAETANHYVLAKGADGVWVPAILSMTSTKLAVSRQWATQMTLACQRHNAPTWAIVYRVTSTQRKNDKGTFFVFKVQEAGFVDGDGFKLAVAFRRAILAGTVKVDYAKSDEQASEAAVPEETGTGKPGF